MNLIPNVIEKTRQWERVYDIYSRMLEDRIIFVNWEIEMNMATSIVAQLLFLEKKDPDKDIIMYINTPGWAINAGFSIYDTMQHIKCNIVTICTWIAASFGAILLSWGTKWKRYWLPHSEVMIHQPLWWAKWQATDIVIVAENIMKWKKTINELLAKNTWQTIKTIQADVERDKRLTATEAKKYWLIDKVI